MLTTSASPGTFARVPRDVKSFIAILSLNSIGTSYLIIVLTSYLPETGLSSSLVGTIVGAQGIALVVAGIPLGILSDRRGRKWILILGSVGLPPMLFTFALTSNPSYLLVVSILGGMAESGFLSTVNAIIADRTPPEGREAAFSLSFIFGTAAAGVGSALPFVFPYLESVSGISPYDIHRYFLFFFGALSLVGPLAFLRILRSYREDRKFASRSLRGPNFRTLVKFSGANSLIGLGAGFIIPLIPTWFLLKFGVQDNYSGPLLAIASITMALAALLSPRLSKKFGTVRAIVINQGLSTIFMFSLAFVGDPILAGAIYVVRATVMNMASPLSDSFLMSVISPEERGFASSLNSVMWRLPSSATTIVGGLLLASGNFSLPFLIAGFFYVLSVAMFYYFFRSTKMIN